MSELLEKLLSQFLEHGLVGALALLACWVGWKLYKENATLRQQMLEREIARVSAYHDLAHDLDDTLRAALEVIERGGHRRLRSRHDEES